MLYYVGFLSGGRMRIYDSDDRSFDVVNTYDINKYLSKGGKILGLGLSNNKVVINSSDFNEPFSFELVTHCVYVRHSERAHTLYVYIADKGFVIGSIPLLEEINCDATGLKYIKYLDYEMDVRKLTFKKGEIYRDGSRIVGGYKVHNGSFNEYKMLYEGIK